MWRSRRLRLLLPAVLVAALAVATPALAGWPLGGRVQPLRVLPLGDSITAGANAGDGYRGALAELADRDGLRLRFVGSQHNGDSELAHEGHAGFRIDQLRPLVDAALTAATPDVVLLHIGSNDLGQGYRVATAPQRLQELAQRVCTVAPNADLLLATIIDIHGMEPVIAAFNAQVPAVVARLQAGGCRAHLVDLHPTVPVGELVDGVHPTAAGYALMAAGWYPALEEAYAGAFAQVTPASVNDDTLRYTGYWRHELGRSGEYWADRHVSENTGDAAAYGFSGSVAVYGTRCPACGIAAVSVDGGPDTEVDLYAPAEQVQVELYRSPAVGPGRHTLQIRVTGHNDPASTGTAVALDRLALTPPTPDPATAAAPRPPSG